MTASVSALDASLPRLHTQVRSLLELASSDGDFVVAIERRFGGPVAPGTWEPIEIEGDPDLFELIDGLRLPSFVESIGLVTWATVRWVGTGGVEEFPACVAMVTRSNGSALSATITAGAEVMWTPHPTGRLADACHRALANGGA